MKIVRRKRGFMMNDPIIKELIKIFKPGKRSVAQISVIKRDGAVC
jgi:hypothetical protein